MKKFTQESSLLRMMLGIGLIVTSIVILLMNIQVMTFGFFRIGSVDSAPILLVVLVFLIVWAVASGKKLPFILAGVDILFIIVSVLIGTRFVFKQMNAFTLIVIIGMFAVGAGLLLSLLIHGKKDPDKDKEKEKKE